ncbi:MAG: ATP-binding cassette domain-containing protein [Actinomycetota bacterium]
MPHGSEHTGSSDRRAVSTLVRPYRLRIAAVALASFAAGLLEAAFLVLVTRAILAIAADESSFELVNSTLTIGAATGLAGVLLTGRLVLGVAAVHLQTSLFHRLTLALRQKIGQAFMSASWPTQARQQRGALQHLVVQFPASIVSLLYQVVQALVGALSLLALLVVAFAIQPLTAVVVLAVVVLLASALWPVRRAVKRRAARALDQQAAFAAKVSEIADLSMEINALGVTRPATRSLDHIIDAEGESQRGVALVRDLVAPVYTTLAYAAILGAVLVLHRLGSDDLDATGAVMLIMLRSLNYGQQLQHGASALGQISPAAERLVEQISEFERSADEPGSTRPTGFGSLELRSVSFAYADREPILRDLSALISRGEIIGLSGASGAGKTTLVHVLLGLIRPTAGSVVVDGVDLRDVDAETWSSLVAYVPQETRLLDGSIADNVRFWRDRLTDQQITRALTLANLVLDADRFPHGASTDLGAAGRQFSGGQRQRLAIARALAAEPAVVVMDEPTSSLDIESEEVIAETIARLRGTTTTIVVSHRESTLAICDRVLVLSDGRLSERR